MEAPCFEPSSARALELRRAMDAALWGSIGALAKREPGLDLIGPFPAGACARALDYSAYFDLAAADYRPGSVPPAALADSKARLRHRLLEAVPAEAQSGGPLITTLAADDYSPADIERFKRWWDIEPDNAMGLTGVDAAERAAARRAIAQALDHLLACAPEMHGEAMALVRDIVLARPDGSQRMDFGGVTSFALWGAFAINVDVHYGWPRYFQTIVHETAHNLLFAIARNEPLVASSKVERHASPLREDARPMDGIFHAMFVSARESVALDRLLIRHQQDPCLTPAEVGEVEDLLEGSVLAFWDCAATVREGGEPTRLGCAILEQCEEAMRANFAVEPA